MKLLFCLRPYELGEGGGCAGKHSAAQVGEPRLQFEIEEACIDPLSLSIISDGVFLGASRPTHWLASKPASSSPMVGISGSASERVAVVTANARSLAARMYSIDPAMSGKPTWI